MAAPTVNDYAMMLLKPNSLTQNTITPLDFLNVLLSAQNNQPAKPRLDPLDVALTGRMRSDVGMHEVASKNMMQGSSAMKTTLEPLTRVQTLLGEMANLTAQAGVAFNAGDTSEYEAYRTQYTARAQEVSNLVKGTTFNGIALMDGASWQSPNSSVTANWTETTDPDTMLPVMKYKGTGNLNIQGGNSTMTVEMIDFGASAKANGHSLVNLDVDVPWLEKKTFEHPGAAPPPGAAIEDVEAYDAMLKDYETALATYNTRNPDAPLPEDTTDDIEIDVGNFEAATDKLFELQDLVGMAIARYGAYSGSMERQSSMHKGQADILKQAVTNQLSGSNDLETLTIDLLRSSIISNRG